jgi:ABC-type glycerol-3-phosphate transport system substrate-binding protein
LDSLDYYHHLYEMGWVNKDAATSNDEMSRFYQGLAATVPQVPSVIGDTIKSMGEENIGIIKPPEFSPDAKIKNGIIGGPGQALLVSKSSKNPEMAVKLASFLCSKAEVLEMQKFQPTVPLRNDITPDELGLKPGTIALTIFKWSPDYLYWPDNLIMPGVVQTLYDNLPLVLVGKMTPMELALKLDNKVAEVSSSQ